MFNTKIDSLTMDETIEFILKSIIEKKQIVHNSINANKIVLIEKYPLLKESLDEADIVSADGQAVIYASKLLGKPLPERVAGIDLMTKLLKQASENLTEKDIEEAKERLIGLRKVTSEESASVMNELLFTEISTGDSENYYKHEEEIRKVTLEEVKQMAKIDKYSTASIVPK